MSLGEYKRKRRFSRTPEPAGHVAATPGRSFVVQKHHARGQHYDLRLELDGVLKSWAVPKGPSLDPQVKRLAVHVEDHPVEYGSFEGIIPEGEYGGGTVMLWDQGDWEPVGDPQEGYRTGRFKFKLHGQKLRGAWMLVRTGQNKQPAQQRQWLLFKERDGEARPAELGDVLVELPLSVATGRAMEEIAAQRDRVWSSQSKTEGRARATKPTKATRAKSRAGVGAPITNVMEALAKAVENYDLSRRLFHGVRLTSPEKELYPDHGITKLELANYYHGVADWMLPHVVNRPLVLVRCPEGRLDESFYQKHPAAGTPENLRRIPIQEEKKTETYVVVDDPGGLLSLAQISAVEIHGWGARADQIERPDRLIFDLDPDPLLPWNKVVQAARQVRQFLEDLGLESFVKTTGGNGLHLVVPLERHHDWDEASHFCKRVAELIAAAAPRQFTAHMAKAARTGKIYVDYLRNVRGSTAVLPYSTRARAGAPVSVPLTWEELSDELPSDYYTIRNLFRRLSTLKKDPWRGIASVRQRLNGPAKSVHQLAKRLLP